MPRNGSGIYEQPFDNVEPNTTVESAVYNGFTRDVEQDLNAARPIIAGGTGANNAEQALVNLKGETAEQVVTNYDAHLWYPGSFRSAPGATGAPNATSNFAGICYINEALVYPPTNENVVIEARDLDDHEEVDDDIHPGARYVREKKAGVWLNEGAWTIDGTGDFVSKAGDTMTGNLIIAKDGPLLILNKEESEQTQAIVGQTGGFNRWGIFLGNGTAEVPDTNTSAGSDFTLSAYDDLGVFIRDVMHISRATGLMTVMGPPVTGFGVATKAYVDGLGHDASFDVARVTPAAASPNTWTAVGMDTTNLDSNSCFIGGFRFTPNVAGWYWISGSIVMPTNGGMHGVAIWKNGVATDWAHYIRAGDTQMAVSQMIFFNGTTDYVELVGLTDYATGGFNRAFFSGFRVRP
jgi:hypothetical protein